MPNEHKAGLQLTTTELHQRQLKLQQKPEGPLVVAVGIVNEFNVGNILRCSEATGVKHVYFVDSVQPSNEKLKKFSRNASNLVPNSFISLEKFWQIIPQLPPLVALEITSNSTDIFSCEYDTEVSFVVGAESQGIPQEVLDVCELAIHLPMTGINSSINVASALCVALYDWQRRFGT